LVSLNSYNILGFIDGDTSKQSQSFEGLKVFPPEHLLDGDFDKVIISSHIFQNEICENLLNLGIKREKIILLYHEGEKELLEKSFQEEIYRLRKTLGVDAKSSKQLVNVLLSLYDYTQVKEIMNKYGNSSWARELGNVEYPKRIQDRGEKPNICLIIMDTVRADHLSLYGYKVPTTPFLEKVAKKGIVFEYAYAPSTWTLPSTVSMLTGKPPFEHGICQHASKIPKEMNAITHDLEKSGYKTNASVSAGFFEPAFGFGNLFQEYHYHSELGVAPVVLKKAYDQICETGVPFFSLINLYDAHDPYKCLKHQWGNPLRDNIKVINEWLQGNHKDKKGVKNNIKCYDDCIAYLDYQIEAFVKLMPKNTVFIILADHGDLFGEQGFVRHDDTPLLEVILRVPLIIFGAGIKSCFIDSPLSLTHLPDIVKRIVNQKEIDIEFLKEKTGFAVSQRAYHRVNRGNEKMRGELSHSVQCLRTNEYKLVWYEHGERHFYKMPNEKTDLINNPEFSDIVEKMTKKLEDDYPFADEHSEELEKIDLEDEKEIKNRLKALGYL
jgi:arylsulfatase A-like enzyme